VSSAILYLAIIAIWAGFLVPAWLRRPHAHSDHASADSVSETEREWHAHHPEAHEHAEANLTVQFVEHLTKTESDEDVRAEAGIHVEVSEHLYVDDTVGETFVYSEAMEYTAEYEADSAENPVMSEPGSGPPAPRSSQSRDQMLRARRKMLSILVGMTAVSGLFTYLGLLPWWIMAPPAVVLVLYMLLLREIAQADAELARKRAAWAAAEARAYARHMRAQAEAERRAAEAAAADSGAQIIDISGRVSDQLYDQYADAAVRAVGD
jgi:hypothetical protein